MSDISPELAAQFDALIYAIKVRYPEAFVLPSEREQRLRVVSALNRMNPFTTYPHPSDDVEIITIQQNRGLSPIQIPITKPHP